MRFIPATVVILASLWLPTDGYTNYYMDDHCGDTTYIASDQARLKTTILSRYQSGWDCTWTVQADYGSKLMVYFKDLDIYSSSGCIDSYLELDDGSSTASPYLTSKSRYCGFSYSSNVYHTSGRSLTMRFKSGRTGYPGNGFDIMITQYRTGSCYSYEHRCNNGRCIDGSLECTSYNPCGDYSDCTGDIIVSGGAIAGAIVGGILFLTFMIIIVTVVCRRSRRSQVLFGSPGVVAGTTTVATVAAPPQYGTAPQYGYNQQYPQPPPYQGQIPQDQYPKY